MVGYDTSTIDGSAATLVRAPEQGGATLAASLCTADGAWRLATDLWNSHQN
jgi:hypothetical protein